MAASSSSPSSENNKWVKLKTSDHKEFVVDQIVAVQSQTIKNMIESDCAADVIPLPNVDGSTLSLIITYCERHASASSDAAAEEELKRFDEEFARKLSLRTRFNVLMAANFLDIKGLLDISIEAIADGIKDKSHQEVRAIFNIENDYSPEEEAQVRAEYAWAFEKFP